MANLAQAVLGALHLQQCATGLKGPDRDDGADLSDFGWLTSQMLTELYDITRDQVHYRSGQPPCLPAEGWVGRNGDLAQSQAAAVSLAHGATTATVNSARVRQEV